MAITRVTQPSTGVLLTNLGTPSAPTARALRVFLRQFLSDRRVIDYPRWIWYPLLYGIILNTRPRRSARLYQHIWTASGSPLMLATQKIAQGITESIQAQTGEPVPVEIGMRYGDPSIQAGLRFLRGLGVERILLMPLFPQYSSTTSATSFDAAFDEIKTWRRQPEIRTVNAYYNHPAYIRALANSVLENHKPGPGRQRLLFSFHGIPRRYALQGDPYPDHCWETARLTAAELGLEAHEWTVSFQSRFGPEIWLQPYTDETLKEWGATGVEHASVICPGFATDCLETLDEIGREGKQTFLNAGGSSFKYILSLNDRQDHIAALTEIASSRLIGWTV